MEKQPALNFEQAVKIHMFCIRYLVFLFLHRHNVAFCVVKKSGQNRSWYNKDGSLNYPPNDGAISGTEKVIILKPGEILGRYGKIGDNSDFVTQTGVDASKLSLPPTTDPSIYREFVVAKEIPQTIQAQIAAWGESAGGGIQYKLPMPIKQLLKEGYIYPNEKR